LVYLTIMDLEQLIGKVKKVSLKPKKHKRVNLRPSKKWVDENGKRKLVKKEENKKLVEGMSKMNLNHFGKKRVKKEVGLNETEYTIATSTIPNAGNGAFANIPLPKGTVLGKYRGKKLSKAQYERLENDSYVWELSSPHGPIYMDAANPAHGNWLRFLNDSRDRRVNVEPYQYRGNIYYRTIRNINPGQELFISYGDNYW